MMWLTSSTCDSFPITTARLQRSLWTCGAKAELYCSEMMGRVADHAVQIHGGYGLMKAYAVERFYRDHKLLEIGEGTSEIQRLVIARHIGC